MVRLGEITCNLCMVLCFLVAGALMAGASWGMVLSGIDWFWHTYGLSVGTVAIYAQWKRS